MSWSRKKGQSKLAPYYQQLDAALKDDFTLNAELLFDKLARSGYLGKVTVSPIYLRLKDSWV